MHERLAGHRARITRAARKLIAHGGFRAAKISAVAKAAGLSTGAIYRFFPSKAQLFIEVLTAAVTHEIEILTAITDSADPASVRLALAVEAFARRALEGRNLAYAFIAEPIDVEVDDARIRCRQQFGAVFERLLRAGMRTGELPAQDAAVAAACLVGAFTEALIGPLTPGARAVPARMREALVSAISRFCVHAVTSPGRG